MVLLEWAGILQTPPGFYFLCLPWRHSLLLLDWRVTIQFERAALARLHWKCVFSRMLHWTQPVRLLPFGQRGIAKSFVRPFLKAVMVPPAVGFIVVAEI